MGQGQGQEQKAEAVAALIVKEVVKVLNWVVVEGLRSAMDWMTEVEVEVEVVQAAEMQKMVFLKSLVVVEACSRAQTPTTTVSAQVLVEAF